MLKNCIKAISAAISCAVILSCSMISAFAASSSKNYAKGFDGDTSLCGVYDEKGIFSDDELDELNELVQDTSDDLNLYILIYLSDTARSDASTETFADESYDDTFGTDTDGVFYYMDLSEQYSAYDYISTSGKGLLLYDSNIDSMLESIFNYLPASGEEIYSSQIKSGIMEICRQFKKYGKDTLGFFDYEYVSDTGKYVYYKDGATVVSYKRPAAARLVWLLIGAVIGIIVAVICYFVTKSHYKFKKSCNPQVYVARGETNFAVRDDRFIRTYTTKTKIETSSGGGSHGGGHSSGGSHGGGGGHR